jgi:phospholipase/carboxylesterase
MSDFVFRESDRTDKADTLFVVFHGTGGNEHQFFELAGEFLPDAHVVAPRGKVSEGGALRYFRRTAEGIYDMEDLALRTAEIVAFVQEQKTRLQVSRVLGLGYSNGANILASSQFYTPELFDAAILMHPLIPFAPQPADFTSARILVTGGRHDPICPPQATQALYDYFSANGARASLFWHDGGHEIRQAELIEAQKFLRQG